MVQIQIELSRWVIWTAGIGSKKSIKILFESDLKRNLVWGWLDHICLNLGPKKYTKCDSRIWDAKGWVLLPSSIILSKSMHNKKTVFMHQIFLSLGKQSKRNMCWCLISSWHDWHTSKPFDKLKSFFFFFLSSHHYPWGALPYQGAIVGLGLWQSKLVLRRWLSCKLILCRLQYWL